MRYDAPACTMMRQPLVFVTRRFTSIRRCVIFVTRCAMIVRRWFTNGTQCFFIAIPTQKGMAIYSVIYNNTLIAPKFRPVFQRCFLSSFSQNLGCFICSQNGRCNFFSILFFPETGHCRALIHRRRCDCPALSLGGKLRESFYPFPPQRVCQRQRAPCCAGSGWR